MSSKKILLQALVVIAGMFLSSTAWAEKCEADNNCDGKVDLTDLVKMKQQFSRNDCDPVCITGIYGGVPKTGQTTSYATGDDGDLEKGVAWPNPRFTDNGNGTVSDNLTGLIWLKNANCFENRTWIDALSDCNGLNSGECGLTDGSGAGDWRLPNKRELFSLVDDAYYNPAVSNTAGTGQWTEGDPFTNVQTFYWSSTTRADNTDDVWAVYIGTGDTTWNVKSGGFWVWPVRGPQ